MASRIILCLIMPLLWTFATAQESSAHLKVPLKKLLIEWQRDNNFEYSGRDDLLSQCMVPNSVNSVAELSKHLSSCKLTYEFRNGVFIILKNEKVSHVSYNEQHLKLNTSIDHHFELDPRIITLDEVVIERNSNNSSKKSTVLHGKRNIHVRLFRNINDLLDNRPSDEICAFVNERDQGLNITYYQLEVSKKIGREIGRVFSFSDETGFYINPRKPKLHQRTNFFEADTIGDFIHFIEMASVTIAGNSYSYRADQLLDIRSGKVKSLTIGLLRKLIADDQQLLEMFNNEKGKSAKLASYLREYYFRKKM